MNEQSMRFRIGVFVLAALILFAVLVMLFGSFPTYFRPADTYTIWFDNAPGVAQGTPIRRSGVRIGEVKSVELNDASGKVRVIIAIDRPHVLYQDDQPVLVRGPLGSDTFIDFEQKPPEKKPAEADKKAKDQSGVIRQVGFEVAQAQPDKGAAPAAPPERVPAKPGAEFSGTMLADVARVVNELSALTPPAQDAFRELRRTLERYERMTPLMVETLREYRDLARTANEMAPRINRTNDELQSAARYWARVGERTDLLLQTNQDKLIRAIDNFESISRNTVELLKESRQTLRRMNDSIARADDILNNLQQATKPVAERSPSIMKNLDEGSDKLNRILTQTEELLRLLGREGGTLHRFLSDPALYNNLNDAACLIVRIMPRLDRILKDIEVFADKIARHPESLGIGGVVSPSAGLKESPTSNSHWRGPMH